MTVLLRFIQIVFRFLIFSNGMVALAAFSQCALTFIILDIPFNWAVLAIEGTSTLILYNFSLFLSKPLSVSDSPFERTRWFFRFEKWMLIITILACIALVYAITQIGTVTLIFLGLIGFISLSYNFPILPLQNSKGGLRQVSGLKIFHIAFIWSLSTVGLPVVEFWITGQDVDWYAANYLGVLKIVFIMICTLPFDIRDIVQDRFYGLKTLATWLGRYKAQRLNYCLLIFHTVCLGFAPYTILTQAALLSTNIVLFVVLKFVVFSSRKSSYLNTYLLDLILVIQFVLVLIFHVLTL